MNLKPIRVKILSVPNKEHLFSDIIGEEIDLFEHSEDNQSYWLLVGNKENISPLLWVIGKHHCQKVIPQLTINKQQQIKYSFKQN